MDEPTRRRLYEYVARHPTALSRDEIATALRVPRATVAFHLEKLVDEDLLDVGYERRNGRSGPGAGRPAKVYRRSQRQVAVQLPERRYDLAGHLLATAVEEADRTGQPVRAVLERQAYRFGRRLGETTHTDGVVAALEAQGFEPRTEGTQVLLGNCPFHTLAREHTQTICAMNLNLLDGLLTGIGDTGLTASLDPQPGHCCVRLRPPSA
nr:helix-turn-helix domain-containing protein [Kibdelosporangium phytohabitans]